jgi:hypothetical protein
MEEPKELQWDKTPVPEWWPTVNAWPWKSIGGNDWEKSGACPRCGHGMTITKAGAYSDVAITEDALTDILVEAERGPLIARSDEDEQFFARCDCGEEHPGRPGRINRGCGQWGEIDPPPGT